MSSVKKGLALIIANADYQSQPQLPSCHKDALTRVIYFVMTGKTNTEKIANQNLRAFVERGLNPDKTKRFQNIRDMISAFKTI